MSPEVKRRASAIIGLAKFIFHWGFIPAVLYLGNLLLLSLNNSNIYC